MRPVLFHAALTALMLSAPFSAHAADKAPPAQPAAAAPESTAQSTTPESTASESATPADAKARLEEMGKHNPEAVKLVKMAQELYNSMPKDEAQRLVTVRTGFSMVRVAEVAKDDIGTTVAQCGKSNPAMKKDLDGRFQAFQDKVMPEVAAQEKKLHDALGDKGNFTKPDQVKAFLDQLDKTNTYAKEQSDKGMVRITTAEACGELGKSMDENGTAIVDALKKIEWPSAGKTR